MARIVPTQPMAVRGLDPRRTDTALLVNLEVTRSKLPGGWNGEGYEDATVLRDNRRGAMKLLEAGDLSFGDLVYAGRHYAAASANVALGRRADWSMRVRASPT